MPSQCVPNRLRSTWPCRLQGGIAALVCALALTAAASLSPHASGHGTHQQLSLPPCSLLIRTGWPCPGCGVTTSIAFMADGNIAAAFMAQPFGVAAYVFAVVLAIAGAGQAATGRRFLALFTFSWHWLWIALAAMLAGWLIKLVIGLAGGNLPIR